MLEKLDEMQKEKIMQDYYESLENLRDDESLVKLFANEIDFQLDTLRYYFKHYDHFDFLDEVYKFCKAFTTDYKELLTGKKEINL